MSKKKNLKVEAVKFGLVLVAMFALLIVAMNAGCGSGTPPHPSGEFGHCEGKSIYYNAAVRMFDTEFGEIRTNMEVLQTSLDILITTIGTIEDETVAEEFSDAAEEIGRLISLAQTAVGRGWGYTDSGRASYVEGTRLLEEAERSPWPEVPPGGRIEGFLIQAHTQWALCSYYLYDNTNDDELDADTQLDIATEESQQATDDYDTLLANVLEYFEQEEEPEE